MNILEENWRNAELNPLLDIGMLGLHIVHNSFQHGEKASNWSVKKLLNAIFKVFDESPSRCTDYEKLTSSSKTDYYL